MCTHYSHAISAFTSSAAASQDFWGVDFDPYGDMFFFDGFWTGGSDFYGSACDAGFGFDDFWDGSFDFWGYNDPYGGFDLFDPWGADYGFDMWDGGWYGGGGDVFNDWILEDDAEMAMMMTAQNSHQGGPESSSQEGRTARFTRASYTPSVRLLPMLQNSCSTGPTGPGSAACNSCMLYKRAAHLRKGRQSPGRTLICWLSSKRLKSVSASALCFPTSFQVSQRDTGCRFSP